ncbi:hypothetical protein BAE30_11835 [Acidithiobacillus caldus]|jgi:hypothetical protein|uniref:Uncharacterized protein n=1 Tax=Acidithiobacillus caldus TaxID=33059 RepID=A0A1E7YTM6_9PROT|nr:hypothetical protein BAE30_11835 [Acidithiobacillus caldus]
MLGPFDFVSLYQLRMHLPKGTVLYSPDGFGRTAIAFFSDSSSPLIKEIGIENRDGGFTIWFGVPALIDAIESSGIVAHVGSYEECPACFRSALQRFAAEHRMHLDEGQFRIIRIVKGSSSSGCACDQLGHEIRDILDRVNVHFPDFWVRTSRRIAQRTGRWISV